MFWIGKIEKIFLFTSQAINNRYFYLIQIFTRNSKYVYLNQLLNKAYIFVFCFRSENKKFVFSLSDSSFLCHVKFKKCHIKEINPRLIFSSVNFVS